MAASNGNGTELLNEEAIKRSVQLPPTSSPQPLTSTVPYVFFMAHMADEITAWGTQVKLRDQQLREFVTAEPIFASALASVCSRNATFAWKLEGPETQVADAQRILQQANFGRGFEDMILRLSIDLYTQDGGAWIETIRESDSPDAPLVGIANLDSARCYPTGHPEVPCIYLDKDNKYHQLKWYQVTHILEMPSTYESMPGLQYSALTRVLRAVQTHRDVEIYMAEKIGGRNTRAITAVRGIDASQILLAQQNQNIVNDAKGRLRYSNPVFVSSIDPAAEVDFKTLEIASIPDGFDLDQQLKWYIAQLALAFLSDYQDFAPLPGGGLGTGAQSETMHEKSKGKGSGLFQRLISHGLNWNVLPSAVEFLYEEQDLSAESTEALNKKTRGEERALRVASNEISPVVARQLAIEAGDLSQEQADFMEQEDVIREEKEAAAAEQAFQQERELKGAPTTMDGNGTPASQSDSGNAVEQQGEKAQGDRAGPSTSRLAVEAETERLIEDAFDDLYADLLKRTGLA